MPLLACTRATRAVRREGDLLSLLLPRQRRSKMQRQKGSRNGQRNERGASSVGCCSCGAAVDRALEKEGRNGGRELPKTEADRARLCRRYLAKKSQKCIDTKPIFIQFHLCHESLGRKACVRACVSWGRFAACKKVLLSRWWFGSTGVRPTFRRARSAATSFRSCDAPGTCPRELELQQREEGGWMDAGFDNIG